MVFNIGVFFYGISWQINKFIATVVLLSNTMWEGFMARVTSVTLGEHFNGFVGEMINSGRYGNTSEVIRDALRMMEIREERIQIVRKMVLDGVNSPESENNMDDIFSRAEKDLNL